MRNVTDYAKFFLKNGFDSHPDTFDGNMKLQKLLFFANFINYAENKELLFPEKMCAFENGTVIEEVRQKYKNDYNSFKQDSINFDPDFSQKEYDVLNKTIDIFGNLTARELSELNHQFNFWKKRYQASTNENGYHHKELAEITNKDLDLEVDKMKEVLNTYQNNRQINQTKELINGVTFFYDPKEINIDEILPQLDSFEADEESYTVSIDDGHLVIM
ncbi:Panacea domain-containing protein [Xylocopilactobacillus apis]|uniref:Antitoxin SocA-like Panacea domain-containing protein n=1 Tax=Xylocopilactobacillus apis TaxID=2932183 RepID=A0AAU9DGR4_9LACO|nr:Panacea domain-containing protein [Xylocopilactobacillus apis]BDR57466.1 hypothetical protein KIMC2_20280 [Xylocopilactobacillus apis]BDR57515.1 hypothetical protein KIMC2_20770 [Xylocopilactobacillus apis]